MEGTMNALMKVLAVAITSALRGDSGSRAARRW